MKKGFTLSEIMIALVVIGVITSILLPVAFNNVPNENVMKFKKGNATLAKVINELVTSGEYYTPGDLGIKADGTIVDGAHEDDETYFCKTIADILSYANVNCSRATHRQYAWVDLVYSPNTYLKDMDAACQKAGSIIGAEIISTDKIAFYQVSPTIPFGFKSDGGSPEYDENTDQDIIQDGEIRLFNSIHVTDEGFDRIYKMFCMDVDGINQGEDPFGYGIRADGKIILGARAQEWMEKSIQEK